MLESKVQKRLRESLERHGCYVVKMHGGPYQSGVPDLLVVRTHLYLIEVKGESRLRPDQIGFFKRALMAGCVDVLKFQGDENGWDSGPGERPWHELDAWVATRFV